MKKRSGLNGQLLTHMRAIAYAPIPERKEPRDDAAVIAAAKLKRESRNAKRKDHST